MAQVLRMRKRGPSSPGSKTAQGYRWVDKDPIIDEVMSLVNDDDRSITAIAKDALLSPSTLLNLDHGKTRRPQNATVEFLLRSMGKRRIIVNDDHRQPVWRWRPAKP